MTDLRMAHRSQLVDLDGTTHRIRRGRTLAVAGHPIVEQHPDLWRPVVIDFDFDGGSPEPVEPAPKPKPKPKAAAKKPAQG